MSVMTQDVVVEENTVSAAVLVRGLADACGLGPVAINEGEGRWALRFVHFTAEGEERRLLALFRLLCTHPFVHSTGGHSLTVLNAKEKP